jgi:glycine cleavage system H protein
VEAPNDRVYSQAHEWALKKDDRVVVGITDHAQDQLGDVIFVQLPKVGDEVTAGEPMGEAESTKTVSEIYSPVTRRSC